MLNIHSRKWQKNRLDKISNLILEKMTLNFLKMLFHYYCSR